MEPSSDSATLETMVLREGLFGAESGGGREGGMKVCMRYRATAC